MGSTSDELGERTRRVWVGFLIVLGMGCAACGGAAKSSVSKSTQTVEAMEPEPQNASEEVNVVGITGSFSKVDVDQTMAKRQDELSECLMRHRSVGVHGAIRFRFKVDSDGKVIEAYPTGSTVGHRDLEECLTDVVASTRFPRPRGASEAEFQWHMIVDPPERQRPAEEWPEGQVRRALRKQGPKSLSACAARARRLRYQVTAYVGQRGRVLQASVVPSDHRAEDKIDCLIQEVKRWRMPRAKRRAKVTFVLR